MSTQDEETIFKRLETLCLIEVALLNDNKEHNVDDELTSKSDSDTSSGGGSREANKGRCTFEGFGIILCSHCKKEVGHIKGAGDVVGHHERCHEAYVAKQAKLLSSPWFYTYDFPFNNELECSEAVRRHSFDAMSALVQCNEVIVSSINLWDTVRGFEGVILLKWADAGTEEMKVAETNYIVEITENSGEISAKYKLTYKP